MSSSTTVPKAKLAAILNFTSLADSLKSKKQPDIIFPPPHWFITDDDDPDSNTDSDSVTVPPVENEVEQPQVPEPMTFAQKLKLLIDKLPTPASLTAAVVGAGQSQAPAPREELSGVPQEGEEEEGPPIPDGVDLETVKLLASQNVMNGDEGEEGVHAGQKRESVWSALDRLNPTRRHAAVEGGAVLASPGPGLDTEHGVMICSPLEPTNESQVELAESREVSRPEAQEEEHEEAVRKDKGKGKETETEPVIPPPPTEKVWVPSTTGISVLMTWWGYRLYLPPPVMATLNSKQLKATKRAAMITTALQWLVNKLPLKMLPPNLKVPVLMLRRLSPFVGYIGVFIAWTWTRICACDQGNGVVMSATWLMPVALIPMAWDAGDIHGPSTRPPELPQEAGVEEAKSAPSASKGSSLFWGKK